MSLLNRVHGGYVHGRRVQVLADSCAKLLPAGARVLDVGCGDGLLAECILRKRPDLQMEGIDVMVRPKTRIPVRVFDGQTIPFERGGVDTVMFVDVLHHTADPAVLLREARRVARNAILIKDHTLNGFLARPTLRFMDWVGNARHKVALPYNYWPRKRWLEAFDSLGLIVAEWRDRLNLYPWPANWLFGRSLHFVARLTSADRDGVPGG